MCGRDIAGQWGWRNVEEVVWFAYQLHPSSQLLVCCRSRVSSSTLPSTPALCTSQAPLLARPSTLPITLVPLAPHPVPPFQPSFFVAGHCINIDGGMAIGTC